MPEGKETSIVQHNALPPEWKMNTIGWEALNHAQVSARDVGTKSVYGGIPVVCKGKACAYVDTCPMDVFGIEVDDLKGNRCPVEISEMMELLNKYLIQFNVDIDDPEQIVTVSLIKELVDSDIMLRRADHKIAVEADYLEDRCVAVDPESGKPIYNKEISKNVEFKDRVSKRRHEILQLLNATPKDKAGSKLTVNMDPSTYATQLLAKARELVNGETVYEVDVNDLKEADE
jgi:hypothetical protein